MTYRVFWCGDTRSKSNVGPRCRYVGRINNTPNRRKQKGWIEEKGYLENIKNTRFRLISVHACFRVGVQMLMRQQISLNGTRLRRQKLLVSRRKCRRFETSYNTRFIHGCDKELPHDYRGPHLFVTDFACASYTPVRREPKLLIHVQVRRGNIVARRGKVVARRDNLAECNALLVAHLVVHQ